RHSLAHLLAAAVLKLYPDAKPTIGPAIDNGFYYDFEFANPIAESDLPKIENVMREILKSWDTFEQEEISAEDAKERFVHNPYKLELIDEIVGKKEPLTLYTSGTFTDLCRGGHVEDAKEIKSDAFELSRIAGAYWRGDEKNKMLTRIYGLAFNTEAELEAYKQQQIEAEKRDHRKIGKELDLFTFSELVGAGLPLFTPKGTAMRDAIVNKISSIQKKYGYQKVTIPHITKTELYKTSGHWEKFGNELFKVKTRESEFVMKPMNCPHHTQIFASMGRSYKDLPLRYAETTMVYRDEQTGELLGLSRVRAITQDDAHIFCAPEQIKSEIKNIVKVIEEFYTALGMYTEGGFRVALSTHDQKNPEKYLGGEEKWKLAESILEEIAREEKLPYTTSEGEAAFYGPKLDFMFKDAIGREWQLGTVQLDFVMPERFGLTYTDKEGKKQTPVMIHRAIAGSLERFMSVIIEHFAGAFPYWLSPVQVKVLPISEHQNAFAYKVFEFLKKHDIRAEIDDTDEGLGKKIRKAKVEKVPYIFVIGDKEKDSESVTIESRDKGNIGVHPLDKIIGQLI
ncbi:MAG: threonine--tRNA ligase, partial [Patescibacteria group bacterium]